VVAVDGARPPFTVSHTDRLRPWLLGGMMALFVARPLFPSESAAAYGDGLTMVMLWIALAVFWLLGAIGKPRAAVAAHGMCQPPWIRFGLCDVAVLLLIGWYGVAALWAVKHGTPRPAINMLWEWVGMGLSYCLARQLIATAREARAVAAVMIALAVALSGYGLYQYAYELPQTRAIYQTDPDQALREAGLSLPPGSPERELFASRLKRPEPIATFALTNSLAAFLAPWLVMLVGMGLGGGQNRKRLLAMVACGVPILACLLLTKSRSGYIAAGVGLALVWFLCRRLQFCIGWKLPAAVVATAAVLVAAAVASGRLDRQSLGQASKSFSYRLQYWQATLPMIADHPLVGCGPGNFQNAYTQYKLPEASEEVADPHNFLLEICATAGTPAALAFLAILGCFAHAMKEGGKRKAEGGYDSGQWSVASESSSNHQSSIINHQSSIFQSPIPNPTPDAWLYVLAGGACGFLLSTPVGMLSAAPPGLTAVLLGLPLAALAVTLLLGWIRDGRLPRLLPAVGVAVLLVALLTTGGIGFPSVAGTLWLLLALGLVGERPRAMHPFAAWAALLAVIALAVTCYCTAYSPVMGCQAQLRLAERQPTQAIEHLEAAAAADPWAAEPWRQLAAVEFENWWQQPSEDVFARFQQADARVLKLTPNSASAWLASGDWRFHAYSRTDQRSAKVAAGVIEEAVAAYRHAVQLYPNSALYRARLAEAYRVAGEQDSFRREAEMALRLDDATPHSNKKLPTSLHDHLVQGLGGGH
jgi:O-antigen ligase